MVSQFPKMSDAETALAHEQVLRAALSTRVGELQEEIARIEGQRDQLRDTLLALAEEYEDSKGRISHHLIGRRIRVAVESVS